VVWKRVLTGLVVCVGTWVVGIGAAEAEPEPAPGQSIAQCFHPEGGYENYGPTDISAQAGDTRRRVTVNENTAGTVTVFKWPNPSYYNQVKYQSVSRDADGNVTNLYPNEGTFAGIRYRTSEGPGFAWFRDWDHQQRYDSQDNAVPVNVYKSPAELGLEVTGFDLVSGNSFQRQFVVERKAGSPVRSASLVAYENFNPVATRQPLVPMVDWCLTWLSDQHAAYNARSHAILNWWKGSDQATGNPSSVALAMGFNGKDSAHQVGADGFDPGSEPDGPADPYHELENAPYRLGGATKADGQTAGALASKLHFDGRGRARTRFTVAAGKTREKAFATLRKARDAGFSKQLRVDSNRWRNWLERTDLPKDAGARITKVSKRALISLKLAMVPKTGAIVASSATQGPYGEDWIRDGAFFNEALDWNGFANAVSLHNRFYARIQASPENPSELRPHGNWAEGVYGDGIDGLPIPWEIDETGLGVWTLYRHAAFLEGREKKDYVDDVYPAIVRAADFLASCEDPANGLQCLAHEDDNFNQTQTIHGAQTTVLALRSAIRAAALAGDTSPRVDAWRSRRAELRAAIERELVDPETGEYLRSAGSTTRASFKEQGWLLWPVRIKPRSDPAMDEMALRVNQGVRESLAGPRGSYELKGVLGLSYQWRHPTIRQSRAMKRHLAYIASEQTTQTGLFGEAWQRFADGFAAPVQDMPHVWVGILFYMSAYRVYGHEPYRFKGAGLYQRRFAAEPSNGPHLHG
jgi:GH15 family glucan-1,4-alpha-glucosidase